jgi:sulfur-oxidizing protein SoxX
MMTMKRNVLQTLSAAMAMLLHGVGMAGALECKPKTAGYFKTFEIAALARGTSPSEASGVTRSLTGALGDPQRGRATMINPDKGNCIACHRIAALSAEPAHGDLGPTLNNIASRYTEAQLRQLVINAQSLYPNTIMPAYHIADGLERVASAYAGKPILSADEVEDVVAFLKTLR